jgi:hypothetical protein
VHSVLGEGACFEVWLPAVAPQRAAADADDALFERGGR